MNKKLLHTLDIKGGHWISMFSFVMLSALVKSIITATEIPTTALTLYGTVLGTYGITKTITKTMGTKGEK